MGLSAGADTRASLGPSEEGALEALVIERERVKQTSARWPVGFESTAARPYQMCTRTVMDTTDPEISFDAEGVSNWVHDYEQQVASARPSGPRREELLRETVHEIRASGNRRSHDCVVGLSGGVDSSYMCVLAAELGLRPLVVHFDNGWNTELAVQNIERMVRAFGFDLHTFVMDWPEFRDLQRAYLKASVLDLEVPTDHMIFGALAKVASQHGIRYVLDGNNAQTEWLLPRSWYYPKTDLANLKGIHRAYGGLPLKKLPALGVLQGAWYFQVHGVRSVRLLDLVEYDKPAIKRRLIEEYGWRDYGGKHHESVFTRFYQGYILPKKFNIDKRKAHLSNLILSGLTTRAEALKELLEPPYSEALRREDFSYVAKKLGFSEAELHGLLEQPNRSHLDFGTDRQLRARYLRALTVLRRLQVVNSFVHPLANAMRRAAQAVRGGQG